MKIKEKTEDDLVLTMQSRNGTTASIALGGKSDVDAMRESE